MTKLTAKKKAAALGHQLGRFITRRYHTPGIQHGRIMYHVAWCEKCGAACFASKRQDGDTNPALEEKCSLTI